MRELLEGNGLRVAHDDDLLTLAERLRIEVKNRRSLRVGRIAGADL